MTQIFLEVSSKKQPYLSIIPVFEDNNPTGFYNVNVNGTFAFRADEETLQELKGMIDHAVQLANRRDW